jgi:hypothetical protein
MKGVKLRVTSEELPNGQFFVTLFDSEDEELLGVAIGQPKPLQTHCTGCGKPLGVDEMCWGIEGDSYCEPCGDIKYAEVEE